MSSLTPAQRSRNVAQVKDWLGRLSSMSGAGLLRLFGSGPLPLEGMSLRQGGRALMMPEL